MTASPGREVDANLLRGAALGSAQARANAQYAGSQDLGDLVEALGGGHDVRAEGLRHGGGRGMLLSQITYRPEAQTAGVRRLEMSDLHLL